jgi:Do/DeqQ family serine protease
MKKFTQLMMAAVLGSAVTTGTGYLLQDTATRLPVEETFAVQTVRNNPSGAYVPATNFVAPAKSVTPAVVHIRSTVASRSRQGNMDLQNIPAPFREFFNMPDGRQMPEQEGTASGSGVLISSDGYVVTNNHVIDEAKEIEVLLSDRRSYTAKVIGTDPTTDLALVKIDATNLPYVPFGNSDNIQVGEWVLAIGNPYDLESTVTAGIVSAKGRNINLLRENAAIESFIQTDAAINPGNSGGALVNEQGQLIGINTAIASRTGSYAGYGFAVPANLVLKVVEDLREHGQVQRAVLGVSIRTVDNRLAKEEGLRNTNGVYIAQVQPGGAAAKAGIEAGDVITGVQGQRVNTVAQLQEAIGRKRPGETVDVTLERDGKAKQFAIELLTLQADVAAVNTPDVLPLLSRLGVRFGEVSEEEAEKYNIEGGAKVKELYPGLLRNQTNIEEGFIITHLNKERVNSPEQLVKRLQSLKGGALVEGIHPNDPLRKQYFGFGM